MVRTVSYKTFLVSIVATATLSCGFMYAYTSSQEQKRFQTTIETSEKQDELGKVHALYQLLQTQYYQKVDSTKLIDGALKGMTDALGDPYTTYLEKSDAEDLSQSLADSFEGIGATLTIVDGVPQISQAPIKESPAEKGGLRAGDFILSVDGKSTSGKSLTEVVSSIRGKKGTDVALVLQRGTEQYSVTLTRDTIPMTTVTYSTEKDSPTVGKIVVSTFAEKTASDFQKAIEALRREGVTSFVIDLRQNPGGLLDQVEKMASMFLADQKTILQLEDRTGAIEKVVASHELDQGFKVTEQTVVLVDKGSASASEIFAGAVKESAAIPLVGTKTFGKGTVQTVSQYQDGSEVKLTIKKWLTPKKEWIHEKGITPSYEVDYPAFVYATPLPTDTQMQLGLESTGVKSLNTYLEGLGYQTPGAIYTVATQNAVKDFQQKHHLSVTGMVDKKTAEAISQAAAEQLKTSDQMMKKAIDLLKK